MGEKFEQNDVKPSRRERKKEETKQRIIDSALMLFQQKGISNTTIEEITAAADVGKGTFYNYFETKEAVVTQYLTSITLQGMQQLRPMLLELPDTKSRLKLILQAWAHFVLDNRELVRVQMNQNFKAYLNQGLAEHDPIGFDKFLADIIAWGQQSGEVRTDIVAKDLGAYLQLLIIGPGSWYCAVTEQFPLEEKILQALSLFLDGCKVCAETRSSKAHPRITKNVQRLTKELTQRLKQNGVTNS